jgi:hypothetical protein
MAPVCLTPNQKRTRVLGTVLAACCVLFFVLGHQAETKVSTDNECGYYDATTDTVHLFQSITTSCRDCITPHDAYTTSRIRADSPYVAVPNAGKLRGICTDGLLYVTEVHPDAARDSRVLRYSSLTYTRQGSTEAVLFTGSVAICIQALCDFPHAHSCRNEL